MRPVKEDLRGRKFGFLRVLARRRPVMALRYGQRYLCWYCRCACGALTLKPDTTLRSGDANCCGRACKFSAVGKCNRTHGMTASTEYVIWIGMRRRCNDPGRREFKYYGARGIRVCDAWDDLKTGFAKFLADVGRRPSRNHTLGRKDNDGPYSPDNCEWQTHVEQARNRRNSLHVTHNGCTKPLKQWAADLGINYCSLWRRLKAGWSFSRAINTPFFRTRGRKGKSETPGSTSLPVT